MSEENETPISINSEEDKSSSLEKELVSSSSTLLEGLRSRSSQSIEEKQHSISSKEKQKIPYNESINEYYRLKDKYETVYYEKYVKPIVKSNKSKREKRVEFSRLPKHECVNCKRNVGTIFNISLDNEMVRRFTAKCGNLSEPCSLDIQISSAYNEQVESLINSGLKSIEEIKLKIIKEKNNVMFFNNTVTSIFDQLINNLKKETENTGFIIESNILKNNNPEKTNLLKNMIDEFGKGLLLPFKQMINEYKETNDELKINSAVEFYINEMMPKLKEIQSMKYNVNYIEYAENYDTSGSIKNVYKLIQLPNSLENTEFLIESDNKVLSFVTGINKSKKAKTMKLSEASLNKTRKIRPIDKLVIEGEEIEVEEIPKLVSKESSESLEGVPDFYAPGGIKWNNEKYNEIWRRLPQQLKDLLETDEEWVQEYVSRCVASKNQKQPCRLFLPKKTIIPPNKLTDGSYDFGLEGLNYIFNKLTQSYKDRLLTWTEEKYAENNYNTFRDILISLLERELTLDKLSYGYGYN